MSSILFCTASPLAAGDLDGRLTCGSGRDIGCCTMLDDFTAGKHQHCASDSLHNTRIHWLFNQLSLNSKTILCVAYITRAIGDRIRLPRRIFSRPAASGLWMDLDYLQNVTMTSLFTDTSVTKCSWKSNHSLQWYKPNCGKMSYLAMLKNPTKKFLDPGLQSDDFQNSMSFSLTTCIYDKNVVKMYSVVFSISC